MKGDLVIVRAFGGVPFVRRVWEENNRGVWVTDDEHFEKLVVGDQEASPPQAGFPREDVFKYDANLAATINHPKRNKEWDWNRLTLY